MGNEPSSTAPNDESAGHAAHNNSRRQFDNDAVDEEAEAYYDYAKQIIDDHNKKKMEGSTKFPPRRADEESNDDSEDEQVVSNLPQQQQLSGRSQHHHQRYPSQSLRTEQHRKTSSSSLNRSLHSGSLRGNLQEAVDKRGHVSDDTSNHNKKTYDPVFSAAAAGAAIRKAKKLKQLQHEQQQQRQQRQRQRRPQTTHHYQTETTTTQHAAVPPQGTTFHERTHKHHQQQKHKQFPTVAAPPPPPPSQKIDWASSLRRLAVSAASTATTAAHVAAPVLKDVSSVVVQSTTDFAQAYQEELKKNKMYEQQRRQQELKNSSSLKEWTGTGGGVGPVPSSAPLGRTSSVETTGSMMDEEIVFPMSPSPSWLEGSPRPLFHTHGSSYNNTPVINNSSSNLGMSSPSSSSVGGLTTPQRIRLVPTETALRAREEVRFPTLGSRTAYSVPQPPDPPSLPQPESRVGSEVRKKEEAEEKEEKNLVSSLKPTRAASKTLMVGEMENAFPITADEKEMAGSAVATKMLTNDNDLPTSSQEPVVEDESLSSVISTISSIDTSGATDEEDEEEVEVNQVGQLVEDAGIGGDKLEPQVKATDDKVEDTDDVNGTMVEQINVGDAVEPIEDSNESTAEQAKEEDVETTYDANETVEEQAKDEVKSIDDAVGTTEVTVNEDTIVENIDVANGSMEEQVTAADKVDATGDADGPSEVLPIEADEVEKVNDTNAANEEQAEEVDTVENGDDFNQTTKEQAEAKGEAKDTDDPNMTSAENVERKLKVDNGNEATIRMEEQVREGDEVDCAGDTNSTTQDQADYVDKIDTTDEGIGTMEEHVQKVDVITSTDCANGLEEEQLEEKQRVDKAIDTNLSIEKQVEENVEAENADAIFVDTVMETDPVARPIEAGLISDAAPSSNTRPNIARMGGSLKLFSHETGSGTDNNIDPETVDTYGGAPSGSVTEDVKEESQFLIQENDNVDGGGVGVASKTTEKEQGGQVEPKLSMATRPNIARMTGSLNLLPDSVESGDQEDQDSSQLRKADDGKVLNDENYDMVTPIKVTPSDNNGEEISTQKQVGSDSNKTLEREASVLVADGVEEESSLRASDSDEGEKKTPEPNHAAPIEDQSQLQQPMIIQENLGEAECENVDSPLKVEGDTNAVETTSSALDTEEQQAELEQLDRNVEVTTEQRIENGFTLPTSDNREVSQQPAGPLSSRPGLRYRGEPHSGANFALFDPDEGAMYENASPRTNLSAASSTVTFASTDENYPTKNRAKSFNEAKKTKEEHSQHSLWSRAQQDPKGLVEFLASKLTGYDVQIRRREDLPEVHESSWIKESRTPGAYNFDESVFARERQSSRSSSLSPPCSPPDVSSIPNIDEDNDSLSRSSIDSITSLWDMIPQKKICKVTRETTEGEVKDDEPEPEAGLTPTSRFRERDPEYFTKDPKIRSAPGSIAGSGKFGTSRDRSFVDLTTLASDPAFKLHSRRLKKLGWGSSSRLSWRPMVSIPVKPTHSSSVEPTTETGDQHGFVAAGSPLGDKKGTGENFPEPKDKLQVEGMDELALKPAESNDNVTAGPGSITVGWDQEMAMNYPIVPDHEDMTEGFERDELLDEALLAFSSLDNIDFLDKVPRHRLSIVNNKVATVRWKQLLANWKHSETWKAMNTRPCSIHSLKERGRPELHEDGESVSSSTVMFRWNGSTGLNRAYSLGDAPSAVRNLSGISTHNGDGEFLVLSGYLCELGPQTQSPSTKLPSQKTPEEYILKHNIASVNSSDGTLSVTELLKVAEAKVSDLTNLLRGITEFASHNAKPTTGYSDSANSVSFSVGVKNYSSIRRKASRRYGGDILQVKDVLRGQVTFPDEAALVCGLHYLSKRCKQTKNAHSDDSSDPSNKFELVRLKNLFRTSRLGNPLPSPLPTGYRHILLNVRLDDQIVVEIQFQLAQMFNVMGAEGYSIHQDLVNLGKVKENPLLPLDQASPNGDIESPSTDLFGMLEQILLTVKRPVSLSSSDGSSNKHEKEVVENARSSNNEKKQNIKEKEVDDNVLKTKATVDDVHSATEKIDIARSPSEHGTTQDEGLGPPIGIAAMAAAAAMRKTSQNPTQDVPTVPIGVAAMAAAAAAVKKKSVSNSPPPNEEDLKSKGIESGPPTGIAAMAAAAAKKKASEKKVTESGIAAMAAAAAKKKCAGSTPPTNEEDQNAKHTEPGLPTGIAAMAAAAAKKKASEKNDAESGPPTGIAAMAAAAAKKKASEKNDAELGPPTGIAAMAAAAAKKKASEKNDAESGPPTGIAAMAAAAAKKKASEKNDAEPGPPTGIAAMAAAAAKKKASEKNDAESAPPTGIAAMAAAAAAAKRKASGAETSGPIGIAAKAAAAAKKSVINPPPLNEKDQNAAGGPMSPKTKVEVAPNVRVGDASNSVAKVVPQYDLGLFSDLLEVGVAQASANPRDLSSFYCLHILTKFNMDRISGPGGVRSVKSLEKVDGIGRSSYHDMSTLSKQCLLRSLAIINQATSVGMVGWLEYGSSDPLERTIDVPFDVLQKLACHYAISGDWAGASDVLGSLVLRCEQQLPIYHPTTLTSMIDLAAALMMKGDFALANGIIRKVGDRLSLYLSEQEELYFDAARQRVEFERAQEKKFRVDTGVDAISMVKAFVNIFQRQLSREFIALIGPEHAIALLNKSFVADAFAVVANCLAASNRVLENTGVGTSEHTYYWSLAYIHYKDVLKGWLKSHDLAHPNAASAACSIARCLRELGKLDEALQILNTVVSFLGKQASERKEHEMEPIFDTRNSYSTPTFLPPNWRAGNGVGRLSLQSRLLCCRQQSTVLCLWLMAVITVEKSPDERGRIRALSLLHGASEALQRAILDIGDTDAESRAACLDMYECVEREAKDLFQPWLVMHGGPSPTTVELDPSNPKTSKSARWNAFDPMRQKRRWENNVIIPQRNVTGKNDTPAIPV